MNTRRSSDAKTGQALVEFAIVLPIALLILAGILQFGLIFSSAIGLNNAVREAARYGSVLTTVDAATATANETCVKQYLAGGACGPGIIPTYVHPFNVAASDNSPGYPPNLTTVTYCYYTNPGSSPQTY
jgi:Flp pilus assembly protein TadG